MKTPALTADQIRMLRMKAQRLLPERANVPASPAQVIGEVFGVQAQELAAGHLAVRARSAGLTAADVERARVEERSLLWTWCMRGTLHLITTEDALWLIPFLGPVYIAADRRRFKQLGWEEERAAAAIRLLSERLEERGELTRPEISRLLEENGFPFEGQAPVHLLYRAALEGVLCAGPERGKQTAYVPFKSWAGQWMPLPRQEALAKLSRRYLEAYAPAAPQDFASWSGLKPGEAREAWQLIEDQLAEVEINGQAASQKLSMLKSQLAWLSEISQAAPLVRLLPRYDTYLLGYASRDLAVDPAHAKRIHPGGGIIHAALLMDGRAVGTWKTRKRTKSLEVLVEPFERLPGGLLPLIEAEAADIGHFLGVKAEAVIEDAAKAPTS